MISPAGTPRCDCGWDFAAGAPSPAMAVTDAGRAASQARLAWVCPLIAWGSQIGLNLALRDVRGVAAIHLAAMLFQMAMIICGLYFGLKALQVGRATLTAGQRAQAILGVVLSGGTILLIAGLSVMSM